MVALSNKSRYSERFEKSSTTLATRRSLTAYARNFRYFAIFKQSVINISTYIEYYPSLNRGTFTYVPPHDIYHKQERVLK